MADKDVQITSGDGGGMGMGLLAGVLLAAVAAFFLIYFVGGFATQGEKAVDVTVDIPKVEGPAGGGE